MRIENPGLFFPIVMAVLLMAMVGCIYVIVRFLRRSSQPTQKQKRSPGALKQLGGWLGEPVSPQRATERKEPESPLQEQVQLQSEPPPLPPIIPPGPKDVVEIMRVVREGALGELAVVVDGQRYQRLVEIKDGAVGRRVLLAIQELTQFAGPAASQRLPSLHRLPEATPLPTESAEEMSEEQRVFLDQLQNDETDAGQEHERKANLINMWRKGLSPSERRAAKVALQEQPKSLVEELDELLQIRLIRHPHLADRTIHFKGTPTGDIRIEVDGGLYDQIGDVPYPEVVQLLKETVRVWEHR